MRLSKGNEMNDLTINQELTSDVRVITLFEICKILGKEHNKAKKIAEEIQAKDGFGQVAKIAKWLKIGSGAKREIQTFNYTKKQALMIGARLDSQNIIILVNKLEELTKPKPLTIESLLKENIKVISQLHNKVITLEKTVEEQKPHVNFAKAITGTTSNIDFETFAKALYDSEGIKMGRNNLMKWFRNNNYLMKNNKPYQTMLDRGLMTLKEGSYINQSTQELVTYTQSRITGKGQMYFTNKLIDEVTR